MRSATTATWWTGTGAHRHAGLRTGTRAHTMRYRHSRAGHMGTGASQYAVTGCWWGARLDGKVIVMMAICFRGMVAPVFVT